MSDTDDHEDDPSPAAAAAPVAPAATIPLDDLIDRWVNTDIAGTEFADTPDKWNLIRQKVENLKTILKIKE